MTPAGWYDDPEQAGQLRWWDGERWTEHRSPGAVVAQAHEPVLVRLRLGKDERTDVVATADAITIHGETFALAEIDGIHNMAVRSLLNGAYMGTFFSVQLRAGDRKQGFSMDSKSKDERLEEFRDAYGRILALLEATACPRLAADMAIRIGAGETITLGPAGARVELSAEGFRLKKPMSKVVPWGQVEGTEIEGGRVFFLVRKPGKEPKRHSMVGLEGENMIVLPHLLPLLRARSA